MSTGDLEHHAESTASSLLYLTLQTLGQTGVVVYMCVWFVCFCVPGFCMLCCGEKKGERGEVGGGGFLSHFFG